MNWLDLESPQDWRPECQAPWAGEHKITAVGDETGVTYVITRGGCPADGEIILGYSRSRAETMLRNLADPASAEDMWRRYDRDNSGRALLDRLAERPRRRSTHPNSSPVRPRRAVTGSWRGGGPYPRPGRHIAPRRRAVHRRRA